MKIGIVSNTGLGDALWMMVVANNFYLQGSSVVLYSDFLCHLSGLFPHITVRKYPKEEERKREWEQFDRVILQHHSPGSKEKNLPPHMRVVYKEELDLNKSFVLNLRDISKQYLEKATTDLGICLPKEWIYRLHDKRIVIHPLSADLAKNWSFDRFITLAKELQKDGWEPTFVLPPQDMPWWETTLCKADLPKPQCLSWMELARFIYESAYFIGNDASPGHLASALKVPTLSIFNRYSRAVFLRPGWGPGAVVLPYGILPGRMLRIKLWKHFLPVKRVLQAFKEFSKI